MARIVQGEEFRLRSIRGLRDLVTAVGSTMGANGGNVIFGFSNNHFGMSKDGVTVANNFYITRDSVAHAVSTFVKQVSQRTNKLVGDGTSSSLVLAAEMYERGLMLIDQYPSTSYLDVLLPDSLTQNDANKLPMVDYEAYQDLELLSDIYPQKISARNLRDLLEEYVEQAVEYLERLQTKVKLTPQEVVRAVARTSSNGDELITNLFVEAFEAVDMNGVVIAEADVLGTNSIRLVDGFAFEGHVLNPVLLNPDTMSESFERPLIFVTDKYIDHADDITKVLKISKMENRPFILICSDISDQLLGAMVQTMINEGIKGLPVKAPYYGVERVDFLHDVCAVTGATFIDTQGSALRNCSVKEAGTVPRVVVNNTGTKFLDHLSNTEAKTRVEERINSIMELLERSTSERETELLTKRMHNLRGKAATISVKVESEAEQEEVGYRLEDALNAIHGALEEGVLPGGGTALILCARAMLSEFHDREVSSMMYDVLTKPFKVLIENSGGDPAEYLAELHDLSEDHMVGIELRSMTKQLMVEQGILDPLKVTKSVLRTSCSVVKTLLQTRLMMTND